MGSQTVWTSLLLLVALQLALAAAQTCDAESSTLSSSCGGVCDSYQPCLIYNVSDSTNCNSCVADAAGECSYVCYNIYRQDPADLSLFVFFITFGTYQSEEEIAARTRTTRVCQPSRTTRPPTPGPATASSRASTHWTCPPQRNQCRKIRR